MLQRCPDRMAGKRDRVVPHTRLEGVEFASHNPHRFAQFYLEALDCEPVERDPDSLTIRCATTLLRFRRARGRAIPRDSRSHDVWFRHCAFVVSDVEAACARVVAAGATIVSNGTQRLPQWNLDAAGIVAVYARDPEFRPFELISFPPGMKPQWDIRTPQLVRGIDHTALVVADLDRGIAYYRDELGLELSATSRNFGEEQARLAGLPRADVSIATFESDGPLDLELLMYREPSDGRARAISPDDVAYATTFGTGTVVSGEDPDGHGVRLSASRTTRSVAESERKP